MNPIGLASSIINGIGGVANGVTQAVASGKNGDNTGILNGVTSALGGALNGVSGGLSAGGLGDAANLVEGIGGSVGELANDIGGSIIGATGGSSSPAALAQQSMAGVPESYTGSTGAGTTSSTAANDASQWIDFGSDIANNVLGMLGGGEEGFSIVDMIQNALQQLVSMFQN